MSPSSGPGREADSRVWPVLSEAVEALEAAWEQSPHPDLAPFLPAESDSRRRTVLVELIKVDQELRWHRDDRRRLEEYLADWPEIADQQDVVADLLRAECLTAAMLNALPNHDELASRFPTLSSQIDLTIIAREAGSGRHSERSDVNQHASDAGIDSDSSATDGTVIQPAEPDLGESAFPDDAGSGVTHIEPAGIPLAERSPDPSNPSSLIGRRLDRYEIVELIGFGNMGAVYRAKDRRLERQVAIKVPLSHPQLDAEIRQRFLREAKSMAQISHPAVCSIFDVGDNPQLPWFAMELVQGETLGQWAARRELAQHEAAAVVAQVAGGLGALHAAGVIHRDIKASNIMIRSTGEPLLMDFGLASYDEDSQLTRTGSLLGTPAYMAPEVVEGGGNAADARSDVYSLGVVLYQLLTGKLPFTGPVTRIFAEIVYRDVERPS
jgi:predicted Ser/Thr protein kinase